MNSYGTQNTQIFISEYYYTARERLYWFGGILCSVLTLGLTYPYFNLELIKSRLQRLKINGRSVVWTGTLGDFWMQSMTYYVMNALSFGFCEFTLRLKYKTYMDQQLAFEDGTPGIWVYYRANDYGLCSQQSFLNSLLMLVTLGFAYPWIYRDQKELFIERGVFGNQRFKIEGAAVGPTCSMLYFDKALAIVSLGVWGCYDMFGKPVAEYYDERLRSVTFDEDQIKVEMEAYNVKPPGPIEEPQPDKIVKKQVPAPADSTGEEVKKTADSDAAPAQPAEDGAPVNNEEKGMSDVPLDGDAPQPAPDTAVEPAQLVDVSDAPPQAEPVVSEEPRAEPVPEPTPEPAPEPVSVPEPAPADEAPPAEQPQE